MLVSQVRPMMGEHDGDSATHSWSIGAYGGQHTLHLDAVSDGTTRLISCPPANGSAESDAGELGCSRPSRLTHDVCRLSPETCYMTEQHQRLRAPLQVSDPKQLHVCKQVRGDPSSWPSARYG